MAYVGNLSASNTHDFNGDGASDIFYWNKTTFQVEFWNEANETAPQAHVIGSVDPNQYNFAGTGDFDGNGTTDILWYDYGITGHQGEYVAWLMDASGNATAKVLGTALQPAVGGSEGYNLYAIGDFNGDGASDIFYWNKTTFQVEFWNEANETAPQAHVIGSVDPNQYNFAGTGDFDGNGTTDILWYDYGITGHQGEYVAWLMDASGNATAKVLGTALQPAVGGSEGYNLYAIGDFNGDGVSDLLFAHTTISSSSFGTPGGPDRWVVWNGTTTATPQAVNVEGGMAFGGGGPNGGDAIPFAAGDFNGDGTTDLLIGKFFVANPFHIAHLFFDAGDNSYFAGNHDPLTAAPNGLPWQGDQALDTIQPSIGWSSFAQAGFPNAYNTPVTPVGDLNGDGTQDILWTVDNGGVTTVIASNIQNGQIANNVTVGSANDASWTLQTSGDYNHDGVTDLLWTDTTPSHTVEAWNMDQNDQPTGRTIGLADGWHISA